VTGSAGAGKTMFGVEFLVHAARELGEPGVLLTFEESAADISANVRSLGFDLDQLQRDGLLVIDAFRIHPEEVVETGDFDLEGLFIRLDAAVRSIGATRVVLDTLEVLFTAMPNQAVVRGEVARLFRWLKERGLTTVVTAERGRGDQLTRHGIEEYVSDCVVALDHRVHEQISTRRLRVVKYRGSLHGTNEYPFLITDKGLVVVPITSVGLDYDVSDERVPTGVARLDDVLSGGPYRGSTMMISGAPGTGKTSLGAHAVHAAAARGERALFVSMEESPGQILRNMRSIGLDLAPWIDAGLLRIHCVRPTAFGFEEHLAMLYELLEEVDPSLVVLDAVASLSSAGSTQDTASAIARDLDLLKSRGVTTLLTTLSQQRELESAETSASSLVDTWLLLRNVERGSELRRVLLVVKSRGSAHSSHVHELTITAAGVDLVEPVGPNGNLAVTA
jgi:circadian clock protein KaiC